MVIKNFQKNSALAGYKRAKELIVASPFPVSTTHVRSFLQRFAYSGNRAAFGRALLDQTNWPNVPQDRFLRRIHFYEN